MISGSSLPITKASAFLVACVVGLAIGWRIARQTYNLNLVSEPDQVLSLLVMVESPVVVVACSLLRPDKDRTSFLKAVGRGLLGFPLGALVNAFGAIILGAPFWIQYLKRTVCWSLLMSVLTFVPAVCVFGFSKKDWMRILALSKLVGPLDYMVSLPAHGAIIGAWFGAWPMPLDWERPWQEWPVCVTYGALLGYTAGVLASLLFILLGKKLPKKDD
ncbi:phosphatidylinositol-glycan biosynthesis class F-like protein [Wolffia australiana]